MIPGEYFLKKEDIIANAGRKTVRVSVVNTGDRPVQIGSHCHFFEVNRMMSFPGSRIRYAAQYTFRQCRTF